MTASLLRKPGIPCAMPMVASLSTRTGSKSPAASVLMGGYAPMPAAGEKPTPPTSDKYYGNDDVVKVVDRCLYDECGAAG